MKNNQTPLEEENLAMLRSTSDRRKLAAMRSTKGFSTEALEGGIVAELLAALENLQASALIHLDTLSALKLNNEITAARKAIAKARGPKAKRAA